MSLNESNAKEYYITHNKSEGIKRHKRYKKANAPIAVNKSIGRHNEKSFNKKIIKKILDKYKK